MSLGLPFSSGLRKGHWSSSICTSRPLGSSAPGGTVPSLQANTPELPPASMCIHSMWSRKFSYCRSVRMTPMGCPLQMSIPSRTVHVSGFVFTLTQPVRSLPLNRSRYCRSSSARGAPRSASSRTRAQIPKSAGLFTAVLLPSRQISDVDVLELHVPVPAGVKLQGDRAVERLRLRVGEVHHLHAVQARHVPVAFHFQEVLVPVAEPHDRLVFRCGPDDPLAAIAVNAAGVFVDGAVHFELKPLGDVGRAGLEVGMEEDAAVPVAFTPEFQRQLEVLVELRRLQIAVLGRQRLTMDDAVFDRPFLLADFDPAGQIPAV